MTRRTRPLCWLILTLLFTQIFAGCLTADVGMDAPDATPLPDAQHDAWHHAGGDAGSAETPIDAGSDAHRSLNELGLRDGGHGAENDAGNLADQGAQLGDSIEEGDLPKLSGKAMHIFEERIRLQEVDQGFQVQIPCNDDSVASSFYDYNMWGTRSTRCEVDPRSAQLSIEFEPALRWRSASMGTDMLILADFERRDYTMRIKRGLRTRDGGELKQDVEWSFTVPRLSSQVRFSAVGRYMPRGAWREVEVSHRNVEEATLEVRRVAESNVAFWLGGYDEAVDARTGDLILHKKLQFRSTDDTQLSTRLPIQELLGAPQPGLYELKLVADNARDVLRVVVTDIQVIAKRNQRARSEQVDVWAVHAQTLQPLAGAQVRALLPSGTTAADCSTDRDGYCRIDLQTGSPDEDAALIRARTPFALAVRHRGDATYLDYSRLRTTLERGETHGAPFRPETAYLGYAWGDRDLYRPQDMVHAVAILRDEAFQSAGPDIPAEWVLFDPRAQVVTRKAQKTNATGAVTLDYRLHETAMTGQWRAELQVAEKVVATFHFGVEEFMPERMRVEASAAEAQLGPDDPFAVDVHARYLFGATAQGSAVTMRCAQEAHEFVPPKNANYFYGTIPADTWMDRGAAAAAQATADAPLAYIDARDRATPACDFAQKLVALDSTARLRAEVAVEEAGSGRVTRAVAHAVRHPAPFYLGLQTDTSVLAGKKPVRVKGLMVDWQGEPTAAADQVTVEVVQLRRRWTWERGRYRSQWIQVLERQERRAVREARFDFAFTPSVPGYDYMVRVSVGAARTELRIPGTYNLSWDERRDGAGSQTNRKPTALALQSKGSVAPGKAHEVQFEAPFKGRALMTVETDEVLHSAWVDVDKGPVRWQFTVDAFAPNVYVSTLLIKDPRVDTKDFMPERAFAALSIPMARGRLVQTLKLTTPEIMRPGESLAVKVDAGKVPAGSFVAVAAVDEGILSLSNYRSPNPLDALLARRALGVTTHDTIGSTLQVANLSPTSRTGGGDDEDDEAPASARIMPFKPVALWSGLKKLPKNGKTTISLDVPLYQGELRVMAVLVTPGRIGQADARVKVRDPIVVQPSFPRFLIRGDQVDVPVFVTNTTAFPQQIEVALDARNLAEPGLVENPDEVKSVALRGERSHTISLEPGKSRTVVFQVEALRSSGAAVLTAHARAASPDGESLQSRAEGTVPFRPAGPLERRVQTMLVSTQSVDLKELLGGWEPGSETTTIRLTQNPYAGAFEHLSALVRYPYGCLEQTISQLRPMVYLSELVQAVDPQWVSQNRGINEMIDAGIKRVLSMQTPAGGFGFWSGDAEPHRWATPYAIYLLMDAERRGFTVPRSRIDRALDWLVSDVKRQERDGYGTSDYYSGRYAPGFAQYVLALAGRAHQAKIRDAILAAPQNPGGEALENVYLLKAALYLTGDRSYEADLKAFRVDADAVHTSNYRSYYSTRRRNALLLNIFVDLFGPHENALAMVTHLGKEFSQSRATGYLYSTQEMGWGLTALGKWFANARALPTAPRLVAGGTSIRAQASPAEHSWGLARASEYASLTLQVDAVPDTPTYVILSSEGVRTKPAAQSGGEGLKVTREFLDEKGAPIAGKLQLGQLVYLRVRLKSETSRSLENIALVARVPAGLEIENARLGAEILPGWARQQSAWHTDHVNVRDDRVEAFGSLRYRQEVEVVIATRATLAGKFHAPTVEAEGMYDTDIWARAAASEVEISHKWSELID